MPEVADTEKAPFEHVLKQVRAAEQRHLSTLRPKWDHYDGLYFGYSRFKDSLRSTSPRDRDDVFQDARGHFGHELHIPFTFAIIELLHARSWATPPQLRISPCNQTALEHRSLIQAHLNDQLRRSRAELAFQTIGKQAQKYGLGVGKTRYRKETKTVKQLVPGATLPFAVGTAERTIFDGPIIESVNIRDFFWDPFAFDGQSLRWAVHRTWRSTAYVLSRLGIRPDGTRDPNAGWRSETAATLRMEDVTGANALQQYTDAHNDMRRAQGYQSSDIQDNDVHEVLEFHDGENVVVVLDRLWPVAIAENPRWMGGLPFHVFRPTEVEHSMVGMGSIEPIEDLQHEIDMLRTDRRWNALMKLHQTYAYRIGVVDPTQIKVGPGELVGVNGDPSNLLTPLTVGDIPNSSYREEEAMVQNIMQASGASDPAEALGGQETATGVMAVQQAQAVRVALSIRRAELELVQPVGQDFAELNRQHLSEATMVAVPPTTEQPQEQFANLGPEQYVDADFDVQVSGGLRPDNTAQDRADVQMWIAALPVLGGVYDSRQVALRIAELMGEQNPAMLLAPAGPQVPPATLDYVKQAWLQANPSANPDSVQQVLQGALDQATADQQAQQTGLPAPAGAGPPNGGPPQNGGPPGQ